MHIYIIIYIYIYICKSGIFYYTVYTCSYMHIIIYVYVKVAYFTVYTSV